MTGIQNRTEELRRALMDAGACLVGFANLSCLDSKQTKGYPFGICFALQHDSDAVHGLPCDEPFLAMGATLSERANQLYALTAAFLGRGGYRHTRISSGLSVDQLPDLCEELPQKTIATLAGLGWIGKSSLLVSSDHGPRIRLAAMLTDDPFQADTPVVPLRRGLSSGGRQGGKLVTGSRSQ
jgi:epoxyqueuosine reductase